nr:MULTISPECIES: AEC family transporter [unclassified Synechocystis]
MKQNKLNILSSNPSHSFTKQAKKSSALRLILIGIIRWLKDNLAILIKNPSLIAFVLGLMLRLVTFPDWLDICLGWFAWSVIMTALVLMGMRLQQLDSWGNIKIAFSAVSIKMFLVPLLIAMALTSLGFSGPSCLVLVLQSAMPSAFATLVLAEAYDLDRDLVVTSLGLSSLALFATLPFWLWGFATW